MTYNNLDESKTMNHCFIEQLLVLKESSLEAVDSPGLESDLKKYMHIDRNVQKDFWNIVQDVADSERAQLILLCGNVGDGKSHILSYYLQNEPETMKKFHIHNDSTASFYKNKPASETLKEILNSFTDENIEKSDAKWIVAINLGTLTNFLEDDKEKKFTKLFEYVKEQKILENTINSIDKENEHFHYVNFSDYHLYTLDKAEVKSEYIKDILKKITGAVPENIFYNSYQKCCMYCEFQEKCPVKVNYELLSNSLLQDKLIDCIIEAVIKGKVILSTRAIFNIFYELLVSRKYIGDNSPQLSLRMGSLNELEYVNSLLPNILFSTEDNSGLFLSLKKCDPLNIKNEIIDDLVISVMNNDNILQLMGETLPEVYSKLDCIRTVDFTDRTKRQLKQECLKLYIRCSRLFGRNTNLELEDKLYEKFIQDLYYWNSGKTAKLREVYDTVEKAALKWNGEAAGNTIKISIGKPQTKYILSQEVKIGPYIDKVEKNIEDELCKFSEEMTLKYSNEKGKFSIVVDFNLYKLIYGIKKGYRPNKKDKNLYIKFDEFVNRIEDTGSQDEKIIIREKNIQNGLQYEMTHSKAFGYNFEVKR